MHLLLDTFFYQEQGYDVNYVQQYEAFLPKAVYVSEVCMCIDEHKCIFPGQIQRSNLHF